MDWLDLLAGAADQIGAEIISFLQYLIGLIVAAFTYLFTLQELAFAFNLSAEQQIGKIFQTIWDDVFKALLLALIKAIRDLHKWLEDHLRPIIDAIVRLRKAMDQFFNTYVKPFLNAIIRIRQFLQILRAFGIKWAGKLDSILGQIEGKVASAFLTVRGVLTGVLDVLSILTDPLNLLRRPTLVLSMRRILPAMVKSATGLPLGFFMPSPRAGVQAGLGPLPLNFAPGNITLNPPASSYFEGDDGLGVFSGFADGEVPDDSAVDDLTILDYFDDGLYPPAPCDDLTTCILKMVQTSATAQTVTATA